LGAAGEDIYELAALGRAGGSAWVWANGWLADLQWLASRRSKIGLGLAAVWLSLQRAKWCALASLLCEKMGAQAEVRKSIRREFAPPDWPCVWAWSLFWFARDERGGESAIVRAEQSGIVFASLTIGRRKCGK